MNCLFTCGILSPNTLVSSNTWDIHPFLPATTTLFQSKHSVERTGLLYMPLVRSLGDGTFEFITGKRCFDLLQYHTPACNIPCRVVAESVSALQLLDLLYEEHTRNKPLTPIELAHYLQLCSLHLNNDEQRELYTTLGFPEKPHFIGRLLELLSLEYPLQAGLMAGLISENIARDLLRMGWEDRAELYALFLQFNIGGGKQKRLLGLLRDLAGREGVSLCEYMRQSVPLQAILNHPEMNIPQKAQSLLQLLQQYHSPALVQAEIEFNTWKKGVALPANCTITHSQAFEHDAIILSVEFKDRKQFENRWNDMQQHIPQI